jgi:hypothetical protein
MKTPWNYNQKTRYLTTSDGRSGVHVRYVASRRVVVLGGWYDSICGIEDVEIPLDEFVRRLKLPVEMKGTKR